MRRVNDDLVKLVCARISPRDFQPPVENLPFGFDHRRAGGVGAEHRIERLAVILDLWRNRFDSIRGHQSGARAFGDVRDELEPDP